MYDDGEMINKRLMMVVLTRTERYIILLLVCLVCCVASDTIYVLVFGCFYDEDVESSIFFVARWARCIVVCRIVVCCVKDSSDSWID